MKKILSLILIVFILMVVVGCSKKGPSNLGGVTTNMADDTTQSLDVVEGLPETEATADTFDEVQEIENDFQDEELENLDEELDEITW